MKSIISMPEAALHVTHFYRNGICSDQAGARFIKLSEDDNYILWPEQVFKNERFDGSMYLSLFGEQRVCWRWGQSGLNGASCDYPHSRAGW